MTDFRSILVEDFDDHAIRRITLNRPHVRNAQNRRLLVELNQAMLTAEADDDVRVVILAGAGPMFSAGHDLGSAEALAERAPGPDQDPTMTERGGTRLASEKRMLQEWHFFFANTLRWRNLRKITIAEVHGPVYSAGLMLAWACDLIVASDDAEFADIVGSRLGMCGLEYFAHPWEFGPRKAKELLLTGDSLSAEEAYRLGMVSKVFPREQRSELTLKFARRIAERNTMAALLIKESVNQSQDQMGFYNALQACFSIHQLNHAHWAELTGGVAARGTPGFGIPPWSEAPPVRRAEMDT